MLARLDKCTVQQLAHSKKQIHEPEHNESTTISAAVLRAAAVGLWCSRKG